MAKHKVIMRLPPRELNRADAIFGVSRDGKKFGTLHVSNGAVVWFPRYASYGCKISWQRFHDLMSESATRVEKR